MSDWIYSLLLAHGYIRLADVQLRSWAPLTLRRVLKRERPRPTFPTFAAALICYKRLSRTTT